MSAVEVDKGNPTSSTPLLVLTIEKEDFKTQEDLFVGMIMVEQEHQQQQLQCTEVDIEKITTSSGYLNSNNDLREVDGIANNFKAADGEMDALLVAAVDGCTSPIMEGVADPLDEPHVQYDAPFVDGSLGEKAKVPTPDTEDDKSTVTPAQLSSSSLAEARAWLETISRGSPAQSMAALGFFVEEQCFHNLCQIFTTQAAAVENEQRLDGHDGAESRQPQQQPNDVKMSHETTNLEFDDKDDIVNDGNDDRPKMQIEERGCAGDEGDEEDTAATSRSGSNPETDDKEPEANYNMALATAASVAIGGSCDEGGALTTVSFKLSKCWRQFFECFVVVFPSVLKGLEMRIRKPEGQEGEISIEREEGKESACLYATICVGIAADNCGSNSSSLPSDGCEEILNLLDELCLFYHQRRFLEEDCRIGNERSPNQEEDEKSVCTGMALLKMLENAVINSFESRTTKEENRRQNDGDAKCASPLHVDQIELLLSQRARWSSVALPSDLQVFPGSGMDDSKSCKSSTSSASMLVLMPLAHLRSLLFGKQQKHLYDSWKQVNARIDEFLLSADYRTEENDQHYSMLKGAELGDVAAVALCGEVDDAASEQGIGQRHDRGISIDETETKAVPALTPNGTASSHVVEKHTEGNEVSPSEIEGSSSNSNGSPSSKKRKKRKGKKKKHKPNVESNDPGVVVLSDKDSEMLPKNSNAELKAAEGQRIKEQPQSDNSNPDVAVSDVSKSSKTPPPDVEGEEIEKDRDEDSAMVLAATPLKPTPFTDESGKAATFDEAPPSLPDFVLAGTLTDIKEKIAGTENPSIMEGVPPVKIASTSAVVQNSKALGGEIKEKPVVRNKKVAALPQKDGPSSNINNAQQQQQQHSTSQNNDSEWETVNTRSRGRKNNHHKLSGNDSHHNHVTRNSGATTTPQQQQQQWNHKNNNVSKDHRHRTLNNSNTSNSNNLNSNHQSHNHSIRRKNNTSRKIAREIVFSVLDGVDEEVRIKQEQAALQSLQPGAWSGREAQQAGTSVKPTVAEVLMSNRLSLPNQQQLQLQTAHVQHRQKQQEQQQPKQPLPVSQDQMPSPNPSPRTTVASKHKSGVKQRFTRATDCYASKKSEVSPPVLTSTPSRSSGLGSALADHSTAPTYQETVSALSSASNTVENGNNAKNKSEGGNGGIPWNHQSQLTANIGDTDPSVEGVETDTQPTDRVTGNNTTSPSHSLRSPVPPLPILLSPENANSTTSSVASSLEAPHGRHHHIHHTQSQDEHNAVGYHLLDVCDRLSQDICLFMKSRAQAVSLRRSERTVLLGALQEVVSGIWSDACRVKLYGSCATLLDLPSSDMDVVIIGLDDRSSGVYPWKPVGEFTPLSASSARSKSESAVSAMDDSIYQASPHPTTPGPPPPYIPVYSANAHRVMRLASAIERLPWAVQVKSIPHATVPVIKILADPSKIPGGNAINDWQGFGTPSTEKAYGGTAAPVERQTDSTRSAAARVLQPWRGSDLMNGLISLDITFQGPEHGGIGSTDYSLDVVKSVCREMGIRNPDDTPFVQCLMVLKELLVQRKLNEPYSGGLSSYALLLLLTALMRERAAIRGELERVEQHRQTATITAAAPMLPSSNVEDATGPSVSQAAHQRTGPLSKRAEGGATSSMENKSTTSDDGRRTPLAKASSTSWASVARNSESAVASSECSVTGSNAQASLSARPKSNEQPLSLQREDRKPISFADVVGKSTSVGVPSVDAVAKELPTSHPTVPQQRSGAWQSKPKWEKRPQILSCDRHSHRKHDGYENRNNGNHQSRSNNASKAISDNGMKNNTGEGKGDTLPQTVLMEQQQFQQHQLYDPNIVPTLFPQGFDDVIEVLCLGETTSGKLLMHFLLHYGQYFDAATTAIDILGKHKQVFNNIYPSPYSHMTPFIERSAPESIDPHTGMLVVDHIVIYDPLEGAEKHNVARRCFAWHQVRWIFAQSYATLSSAVEKSVASRSILETTVNINNSQTTRTTNVAHSTGLVPESAAGVLGALVPSKKDAALSTTRDAEHQSGDLTDLSSPLLKCLLSF